MPAVLNAANEQAVNLFLAEKIGFNDIPRLIEQACAAYAPSNRSNPTLEELLAADAWARDYVLKRWTTSAPVVVPLSPSLATPGPKPCSP